MAHGIWLERIRLDAAMEKLAALLEKPDTAVKLTRHMAVSVLKRAKEIMKNGFVLESSELMDVASAMRASGWPELAREFELLADIPADGPCSQILEK